MGWDGMDGMGWDGWGIKSVLQFSLYFVCIYILYLTSYICSQNGIRTFGDALLVTWTFGDTKDLVTWTFGDRKDLVTLTIGDRITLVTRTPGDENMMT